MSTTSSIDAWAALVAAAREYARLAFTDELDAVTLHLGTRGKVKLPLPCCQSDSLSGDRQTDLTITDERQDARQVEPDNGQTGAGTIAQRICQVLTLEPQTRKKVARLAGCNDNSHFRQTVASLIRQGKVIDTPDGIKLPPGDN